MPESYSSGSSINFEILADSSFHENADSFTLYRKSSLDSSWTEWENQNIQSQWRHTTSSSDADFPAWTYLPDKTDQSITLNNDESKTVSCDGEIQIEATDINDSTVGMIDLQIGGTAYTIFEGEYLGLPGCDGYIRAEEVGSFPYVELQLYYPDLNPSDGSYRYKAVFEDTNGDFYHGDSIYTTVGYSLEAPYIENVTYEDNRIYDFKSDSGLKPGGTIYVSVKEFDSDDYVVTLEDRTGSTTTDIHRANITDGELKNSYDIVVDFFLDPFFDASPLKGENSAVVPLRLSSEALKESSIFQQDGSYEVGFRINEIDGSTILSDITAQRQSPTYSVTTDGTSFAPNITSVGGSPDCSSYQSLSSYDFVAKDLSCIRVEVTDSDDDRVFVDMNLSAEYDNKTFNSYETLGYGNDQKNGHYYIFNLSKIDVPLSKINESGEWTAEFEASDGINNDTETVSWSVPWGSLQVERVSPSSVPFSVFDNETFLNSYRISCSGGPECVNQNESVQLAWDPKPVDNLLGGLQ